MALKIGGVNFLYHIPADTEMECHILQCHGFKQIDYIYGKALAVGTAACGKSDVLLLVVVAVFILALIALDFHAEYHPPATL